jgi:hypothetical protein
MYLNLFPHKWMEMKIPTNSRIELKEDNVCEAY